MNQNTKLTNPFQLGLLGGLGVLSAIVIGSAIASTATIITYVAAALFIALGLDPIVKALVKIKLPRPLAVALVVSGFLGFVALFIWAVLPVAIMEAGKLIEAAPDFLQQLVSLRWVANLDAQLDGAITAAAASAIEYITNSSNWPTLVGGVFQIGLSVVNGVIGVVIVVILTLYFMISLESMKNYVAKLVASSKRARFKELTEKVATSVGRWVMGQAGTALIHAVALFVFLTIQNANFALLLAVIAFVFALIPLVGPSLGGAVVVLISLIESPSSALVVAIYYLIYLQIEAYVISPRIMKRAVQVPSAVVVIAALMGGTLLGVLGALIAIPVAASILLIVREVWMPLQQNR